MRRCIQYAVICNSDPNILVKLVSEEIVNGMEPLGGTSVTVAYVANPQDGQLFSREQILCQAVARWKEVPDQLAPGLVDYQIVSQSTVDNFNDQVGELVRNGYIPVGEPSVNSQGTSLRITQGFSKPKPEVKSEPEQVKHIGKVVKV
jgi:hypothetical protein